MQVITTDRGVYIDNLPGQGPGGIPPGFEWEAKIGQTVHGITINRAADGNRWINKSE
jgi:hypothetical protein